MILDEKLQQINDDYKTERGSVLQEIEVVLIPTAIFYLYQKSQGKLGGQNKFPRVMKKEKFDKWEAFVQEKLSTQEINLNELFN